MMLSKEQSVQLLKFVWKYKTTSGQRFSTADGRQVEIVSTGVMDEDRKTDFADAVITIDGCLKRGDIAVHDAADDWFQHKHNEDSAYDGVILHVVGQANSHVLNFMGDPLPTVELKYPASLSQALLELPLKRCNGRLRSIKPIDMMAWLTRLYYDRFERKCGEINAIYDSVNNNWNETFHIYLFRTMAFGGPNRQQMMRLARTIPYEIIARENNDPLSLEALLFGAAGYLSGEPMDDYSYELRKRFRGIQQKYRNDVININEWMNKGLRPANLPAARLVQLCLLLRSGNFTFENILRNYDNPEAIRSLVKIEFSPYWQNHRSLAIGAPRPNSIGTFSVDILMINLVAPILFAYGKLIGNIEITDSALEMTNKIAAEKNKYTMEWCARGISPENAFFSQALIQISTEYCNKNRCPECLIGIKELKSVM